MIENNAAMECSDEEQLQAEQPRRDRRDSAVSTSGRERRDSAASSLQRERRVSAAFSGQRERKVSDGSLISDLAYTFEKTWKEDELLDSDEEAERTIVEDRGAPLSNDESGSSKPAQI